MNPIVFLIALTMLLFPAYLKDVEAEPITIKATITAYTSLSYLTDDSPTIMASNKKVYVGAMACPRGMEFGTKILFRGDEYTCEDRMNKRYEKYEVSHFDIYKPTLKEAKEFGVVEKAIVTLL